MSRSPLTLNRWSNWILAIGALVFICGAGLHACASGLDQTVLPNPSLDCKTDSCIR